MTTLREWATVHLVAAYNIPPTLARKIVQEEADSWRRALIPFNWNEELSKASRFQKKLALHSTVSYMYEWRRLCVPSDLDKTIEGMLGGQK